MIRSTAIATNEGSARHQYLASDGHSYPSDAHGSSFGSAATPRFSGHTPVMVPQVLYEYWVVATRPAIQNGLGLTAADARSAVDEYILTFPLLRDERGIFAHWLDLVAAHGVVGKVAHDARLAAAMKRHGLTHLMTFNVADFARFQPIVALPPGALP